MKPVAAHHGGSFGETSMRLTRFVGLLAATLALSMGIAPAASAQLVVGNPGYNVDRQLEGISNLSAAYTNATTTATVLPGTPVTIPATQFDPLKRYIQVCFSADAVKNTGGTGALGVAQDGVAIPVSLRYTASGAGRSTISGCYAYQRTTAAATTISIYGVSSDTNSFQVTNANVIVTQWRYN